VQRSSAVIISEVDEVTPFRNDPLHFLAVPQRDLMEEAASVGEVLGGQLHVLLAKVVEIDAALEASLGGTEVPALRFPSLMPSRSS